jgi:peptidyl-prolyl cis-trans isomerase A (cyclophilin A)
MHILKNALSMGILTASLALPALLSNAATAQTVEIKTNMGTMVAELWPDKAPKTVENFVQYVKDGFYSGTIFHRVIPTFMIQGGGFDRNMVQKATRPPVAHEGQLSMSKGGKNEVGTLAMARTSDPNSATAQFFINTVDNAFLDPVVLPPGDPVTFTFQGRQHTAPRANVEGHPQLAGYVVFGKVTKGMDVAEKIKAVKTANSGGHQNVPSEPVIIESIKLVDAKK